MTTTAAPSAANCFAMSAPIPFDAPVTTAIFPASFPFFIVCLSFGCLKVVLYLLAIRISRNELMVLVCRKGGRSRHALVSDICPSQSELGDMRFHQVG